MTAITAPLAIAALIFLSGAAWTGLFRTGREEADGFGAKATIQLLFIPVCFAIAIFIVDGLANHLYWARLLQP